MNLMKNLLCTLLAASCVASNAGAMSGLPYSEQIKEPEVVAAHNQLRQAQQEVDALLKLLPAQAQQQTVVAVPAAVQQPVDMSIVAALKQVPLFLWNQKRVVIGTLMSAAVLASLVGYYNPIMWGTTKAGSYAKNVGLCVLLPLLGYKILKLMNVYPRSALGIFLTFLTGVCFLRYRELVSDETFAGFAIPLAGVSAWQCQKVKNYKPKKEDADKKKK